MQPEAYTAWEDEIIDRYDDDDDDASAFRLKYAEEGIDEAQPYTDWAIIVACPEMKRTFHVHKPVLSKACPYFKAMFSRPTNFAENTSGVSQLDFPPFIVAHFHIFLKYLYSPDYLEGSHWNAETEGNVYNPPTVCTLLFLGNYFGLTLVVKQCQVSLKTWQNNKGEFKEPPLDHYRCSVKCNMGFLRDFVIDWCAFACLTEKTRYEYEKNEQNKITRFFKEITTDLFLEALRRAGLSTTNELLVERMAEFCNLHNEDAFRMLNVIKKEDLLPSPTAEFFVMQFKILQDCCFEGQGKSRVSKPVAARLQNALVKDFYAFLLYKRSLSDFDQLQLDSKLPLCVLKSLVHQSIAKTNERMPRNQDPVFLTSFLRQCIGSTKLRIKVNAIPVTISGLHVRDHGLALNGTYYYDGARGYYSHKDHEFFVFQMKKQDGRWLINFCGGPDILTVTPNQYQYTSVGIPPFQGWKTRSGADAKLTVGF